MVSVGVPTGRNPVAGDDLGEGEAFGTGEGEGDGERDGEAFGIGEEEGTGERDGEAFGIGEGEAMGEEGEFLGREGEAFGTGEGIVGFGDAPLGEGLGEGSSRAPVPEGDPLDNGAAPICMAMRKALRK